MNSLPYDIFQAEIELASEKAGERRSTPGSAPYFSHSLPVSFHSRKFLETPARQAKESPVKKRSVFLQI